MTRLTIFKGHPLLCNFLKFSRYVDILIANVIYPKLTFERYFGSNERKH